MSNTTKYPKPDRSSVDREAGTRTAGGELNLGWSEGVMSGGRPYVKEYWSVDDTSILTFFFSATGLEHLSDEDLRALLEAEGLIRFLGEKRYCAGKHFKDESENDMWSVNVVIGFEDEIYASDV